MAIQKIDESMYPYKGFQMKYQAWMTPVIIAYIVGAMLTNSYCSQNRWDEWHAQWLQDKKSAVGGMTAGGKTAMATVFWPVYAFNGFCAEITAPSESSDEVNLTDDEAIVFMLEELRGELAEIRNQVKEPASPEPAPFEQLIGVKEPQFRIRMPEKQPKKDAVKMELVLTDAHGTVVDEFYVAPDHPVDVRFMPSNEATRRFDESHRVRKGH